MPETQEPGAPPSGAIIGGPLCPHCIKPMRLDNIKPNPHFINLDAHHYRCECGAEAIHSVARLEP